MLCGEMMWFKIGIGVVVRLIFGVKAYPPPLELGKQTPFVNFSPASRPGKEEVREVEQ